MTTHSTSSSPTAVHPLCLRRAVFGALLRSPTPLTLGDVIDHVTSVDLIDLEAQWCDRPAHRTVRQCMSDQLRWQIRAGRVERVGRGVFAPVRSAISPSTQWRCLNWRRIAAGDVRGR